MEKRKTNLNVNNNDSHILCKKARANINQDNSVIFDDINRKRSVLSLKDFCAKSLARYKILQQYPTLHMFSIVRQIINDLIDAAICGGDTISIDKSYDD